MNDIIFKTLLLKGETGNNIASIEKTATSGIVDTYTITLTDGSTTTFEVTNGSSIESVEKTSTQGDRDIYTITLDNGETYNFTVTNATKTQLANVINYGAIGDGVTDDTQAFIDALADTDYNGIEIPSGTYLITSMINITRDNSKILSNGGIIKTVSNDFSIFSVKAKNVTIDGLTFDDATQTDSTTRSCIICYLDNTDLGPVWDANLLITNCNFINCKRRCINLSSYISTEEIPYTVLSRIANVTISNCRCTGTTRIFVCQSGVWHTNILGNVFSGTTFDEVITVDNGSGYCIISGNDFHGNVGGTGMIGVDQSNHVVISNNIFRCDNDIPIISMNGHTGTNSSYTISDNAFIGLANKTKPNIYIPENGVGNVSAWDGGTIANNTFTNGIPISIGNIQNKLILNGNRYRALLPVIKDYSKLYNIVTDYMLELDLNDYLDSEKVTSDGVNKLFLYGENKQIILHVKAKRALARNELILTNIPVGATEQAFKLATITENGNINNYGILLNTNGSVGLFTPLEQNKRLICCVTYL
jgi:hypothetical protein